VPRASAIGAGPCASPDPVSTYQPVFRRSGWRQRAIRPQVAGDPEWVPSPVGSLNGGGLVETWIPAGGSEIQRRAVKTADGNIVVTECLAPKWSNDELTANRPLHLQPCLHRVLAGCQREQDRSAGGTLRTADLGHSQEVSRAKSCGPMRSPRSGEIGTGRFVLSEPPRGCGAPAHG
jgi:hypothetical protein